MCHKVVKVSTLSVDLDSAIRQVVMTRRSPWLPQQHHHSSPWTRQQPTQRRRRPSTPILAAGTLAPDRVINHYFLLHFTVCHGTFSLLFYWLCPIQKWLTQVYSLFIVPCEQKTNLFLLVEKVMWSRVWWPHFWHYLDVPNREALASSVPVFPSCSAGDVFFLRPDYRLHSAQYLLTSAASCNRPIVNSRQVIFFSPRSLNQPFVFLRDASVQLRQVKRVVKFLATESATTPDSSEAPVYQDQESR